MQLAPSWFRQDPARFASGRRAFRVAAASALTLLCLGSATRLLRARTGDDAPAGSLLQALGRELDGTATVLPRLSVASVYRPCPAAADEDRCAERFAPSPPRGLARVAARAGERVRAVGDPEAMHAAAVIDVVFGASGKSLERAIYSFRSVARTVNRPAPVLADLAAAYLVRAERTGAPRDLLVAADVAHQALRLEPRHAPARYNLALALHRFGLVEEAAVEWRAYLAADSTSGWASEARRRLAQASVPAALPPPPAADAPLAAFSAYAAADPQRARMDGWNRLLSEWGRAVLAGSPSAEGWLRRAAATGEALERRPGGDATLADAVRAIRAAPGTAALRRLALAHREYAAGAMRFDAADYGAAGESLAAAEQVAGGSPVLRRWAQLLLGPTRMWAGDWAGGEALLRSVVADTDTLRHPALAGRAHIALSTLLLRADRYEAALEQANAAARLLTRAGERELLGGALIAAADAQLMLHDADAGYATLHRALAVLRAYPGSTRLHSALVTAAESAADDGLLHVALRAVGEDVRVAGRIGGPALAEARVRRARFLAAAGEPGAAREVNAARAALRAVADVAVRQRLEADLRVTEAFIGIDAAPAGAAAQLDSAARVYDAQETPFLAYAALVGAARAHLAGGELDSATARLQMAFGILERRRDATRMEPRRAAVFDAAQSVVDRVVMLELAAGRTMDALRYLDRGRATQDAAARWAPAGADRGPESPPGEVAVEYALIADTLLAWTVAGRQVRLFRVPVDTARLVGSISRLRMLLEGGGDAGAVDDLLTEFYEQLVRPLEPALGRPGTPLVIIADGDLASVPFAALRNARGGRYLMQDHPLRSAVSLREAQRGGRAAAGPAVFVADPAFTPTEHPGLRRLPGAAAEARSVAGGYARPELLAGAQATPEALRTALERAGLVHYAGHAVFDDERPERSYLVLAPVAGRPESGRMTAEELAGLELRGAPLVVLAACQSVNAGRGRSSGFTGLAGALLRAGAGGVVGGLWEVEDTRTRTLMTELHFALRSGVNGAAALRQAQVRMLASTDAALRSPAAWAGFRYVGQ